MSFWDLSDGETAKTENKEYEIPGGNMDPLPNNSDVLAEIKEAKWKGDDGAEFISIQWSVQEPAQFKNRVVFQKLWVSDLDPSAKTDEKAKQKRDKARRMLATIDANAKGRLMSSADAPTDDSMALALHGALMIVKCMVWEMPDREHPGAVISGNWISAVKPRTAAVSVGEDAPRKLSANTSGGSGGGRTSGGGGFDLDDENPF